MRRKYQLIAIACVIVALAAAVAGTYALKVLQSSQGLTYYEQSREAQHLTDLSMEDQAAASSLSTDPATFASHLPVVSIDAEAGTFQLFSHDGANRLSDEPAAQSCAEVRYRGNSSRLFDKKSYAIELTAEDRTTANGLDLLGMGEASKWVLTGPFLDKTLVRNYVAYCIAGHLMQYTPEVRFCEVFVNGEYMGVYLLTEPVKVGESRVSIGSSTSASGMTSYVVQRDRESDAGTGWFSDLVAVMGRAPGTQMEIVYPTATNLTDSQSAWIQNDLNAIEKALHSKDYDTLGYGYANTLDVSSFVDYYLINEFAGNIDAGRYSTYMYKQLGGKLAAGPVWDFNNAFGNYSSSDGANDGATEGFIMTGKPFFSMLLKDEQFTSKLISRYRELRQSTLSDEYLNDLISSAVDYLGPAIERNYEKWGYSFDPTQLDGDNKLSPDERNPRTYDEAVTQLKTWITQRGAWLDTYIENLRQYSHESAVKKYN